MYGIREKKKRGRKSLVYWGVSKDPHERWSKHKSKNGFTDKTHEFIIFFKVTAESRLFPDYELLTNALILETVIHMFEKHFSPCKEFKAGNGSLQSSDVKQLFNSVLEDDDQKNDVLAHVDFVLTNGKHMGGVEVRSL